MAELRSLAVKAFGGWQRGAPVRPALRDPETTNARLVIVDKPGSPQTELRVAWLGPPRSNPDFVPLQVMNNELGGLFSSRINMNLREQHGYSYGARSFFAFRRNGGPFTIGAGVRTDATAPAVAEIFKEVRGMIAQPVTADQLRKAKDALANSIPAAFETSLNSVNSFSNIFVYDLGLDYYTTYAQRVNAVTAAQALDVARRYVLPDRLVVIAVGDRSAIEADLRKLDLGPVEIRDAEGRPVS
jgi:zinc protease